MKHTSVSNPDEKLFYKITSKLEYYFMGNLFFALSSLPFLLVISVFTFETETIVFYLIAFLSLGGSFSALNVYSKHQGVHFKRYLSALRKNVVKGMTFGLFSFLSFMCFYILTLECYETNKVYFLPAILVVIAIGLGLMYLQLVDPLPAKEWEGAVVIGVLYVFLTIFLIYMTKTAYFVLPMFCSGLINKWKGKIDENRRH